jgi:hypothetical protein
MSSIAVRQSRPSVSARVAARARTLGLEALLGLGGLAVIGIHVVDDRFVQPPSGTQATDHLVSGLVPLALLALAGLGLVRARAGIRAVIAILTGLFGLIASVEAVYYAREQGSSGDDYSGFLAIPAGLLLLGLGAVTLWRSRRLDDSRVRRYERRSLLVLACYPAVFLVAMPFGFGYISTHVGRGIATDVDLPATARAVTFTTSDGLTLRGTYIPSTNGAAVVVSPGYNEAPAHARMLARHGYGALLFDQRGEGRSDGDPNGWGWAAEKDMVGAIRFLQAQPDVHDGRIGGIGLSVAGESLLQTAAHHDDLKAIVAEGAGSRSYKEEYDLPRSAETLLALPFAVVSTGWTSVFSDELPPAHLADVVAGVRQPVFLIWSEQGVPSEVLTPEFYERAQGPKTLWQVDADHTKALETHPQEYERRVVAFLDDALLGA